MKINRKKRETEYTFTMGTRSYRLRTQCKFYAKGNNRQHLILHQCICSMRKSSKCIGAKLCGLFST